MAIYDSVLQSGTVTEYFCSYVLRNAPVNNNGVWELIIIQIRITNFQKIHYPDNLQFNPFLINVFRGYKMGILAKNGLKITNKIILEMFKAAADGRKWNGISSQTTARFLY